MWPWRWLHHFDFQHWRWLHALMTMVALFRVGNFLHIRRIRPSRQYNKHCVDIGNRHSLQVTHSYKERIFHLFPPQLKTNLWMIWHHKLILPLSAKYSQFQGMVMQGRAVRQIWGHFFHNARNPQIWPVSPIQNWTRVTRWTPQDPMAARITGSLFGTTLQWRHNERDGVSNHRRLDFLLNCLFRRRSKNTSKLRVTGLCEENSPVTGEFPAVAGEFPAQKPVTRNMFPFDDIIMKPGNIDVRDECSSMKCEVSAPP